MTTTPSLTNQALADELEAVNSIYDADTLVVTSSSSSSTSTSPSENNTANTNLILKLPSLPLSFQISFPPTYPDIPPSILGTQSTGPNTRKGEGEYALGVLRDVLGRIFVPGQVCLFDLIEEGGEILQGEQGREEERDVNEYEDGEEGSVNDDGNGNFHASSMSRLSQIETLSISDLASTTTPSISSFSSHTTATDISSIPSSSPPNWILSEPLIFNKSTFVARALSISSLKQAKDSISHLLSTNRKVAGATHNITAWRIKQQPQQQRQGGGELRSSNSSATAGPGSGSEIIIQDCDDDGETAAGGRLLHLMQLMNVWNVLVVVTRWYGGVKLGPDRFRLINSVAREVLVSGGFAKEEEGKSKGKGGKKK